MEPFFAIFDSFLMEAVVNGILLGGLFALLSLGLNLIFGVIDVVWICYAELIMVGMYAIWWMHVPQGLSLWVAFPVALLLIGALGAVLHYFIIRPVLGAEPINQLLVTGGVLFLLQALATVTFGVEFRNIGVRMPGFSVADMYLSSARLLSFGVAIAAIGITWWFLSKTFTGVAIRAISQDRAIMPLMGVNPNRVYLVTSAIGGTLAGLAACLLVLQYDIHPAIGLTFGPLTFLICVMGGLGNLIGGFVASFIFAQFISVGGFLFQLEWGYVLAFVFFIAMMFLRPQGLLARRTG
ncbi:MAG: branched-chain amino acid ABC transporter permease [Telluria sp.]